jgi:hypothetical protein
MEKRSKLRLLLPAAALIGLSLACGFGAGDEEPTPAPAPTSASAAATNAPEPTAVPTDGAPAMNLDPVYVNEEGGFSVGTVPGYSVDGFGGFATMTAPDGNADDGPLIVMIGGLEEEAITNDDILDGFSDEVAGQDGVTVSDPVPTTVAGFDALRSTVDGTNGNGTEMDGAIVVVLPTPNQFFVIIAAASVERWDSELSGYFEAVLESVEFFTPTEADAGETEVSGEVVRQWAASAVASSEYTTSGWSAVDATGAPDTYPECGDFATAWASESSDGLDWIELQYASPVIPTEINIYETHSPDQISSVDVIDVNGNTLNVYTGVPEIGDECPLILSIPVSLDVQVDRVVVTVDQTLLPWSEIDAVELVGLGEAGAGEPAAESEVDDTASLDVPENFEWRIGGESGFDPGQFYAQGGVDTDENDIFYVADDLHGVYVIDAAGTILNQLEPEGLRNANDVKVGPDGNLYVSAWGSDEIVVMTKEGELVRRWGEEGNGPGQFGTFSPSALAVGLDGAVYVLDENEDDSGEDLDRIQIFSAQGVYQGEWLITEDFFAPSSMDVNPNNGNVYLLGFIGGYIVEYDTSGNVISRLGQDALDFSGPQHMTFDDAGNIYVSTWTPQGVMMLDPEGNLIQTFATQWDGDDVLDPPLGSVGSAQGVGVLRDGSLILIGDWPGQHAFMSAFSTR